MSWITHVSEDGGFSVRLPADRFARVIRQTGKTKQNVGQWPPFTFEGTVLADGTKVGVYNFDSPTPIADYEALDGLVRFLAGQYHGDVTFQLERDLTIGGHVGSEVVYRRHKEARSLPIHSRWCLVGRRIYEVAWMPGRDEPSEEALSTLFDSFEIVTTSPQF